MKVTTMRNKHVKLNIGQLRKLIKETGRKPVVAVNRRPRRGTPHSDELEQLIASVVDYLEYDPGDPSAAALGEKHWDEQKSMLEDRLETEINEVIDQAVSDFINGETNFDMSGFE